MSRHLKLWMVNQYALRPGQAGGTRHATLADGMTDLGVDTLVIHASDTRSGSPTSGTGSAIARIGRVDFVALKARPYTRNGLGRLVSTLAFAGRVIGLGLRPGKLGGRPSVILGSSPDLLGAAAAWAISRWLRVPFVWEVRDVWPASLVEVAGVSPRHPYVHLLSRLERFLCKHSSAIIGLLEGIPQRVSEVSGSVNAEKVTWIPNGASLQTLRASSPVAQDIVVVYTGAHGVPNSLHTLLEAVSVLETRTHQPGDPQFKFHLYGDGVSKQSLLAQAAKNGLTSVTFHDLVPKAMVQQILSSADIAVLPGLDIDLYRYGASPNKLYDYMAAAVPVVTSLRMMGNPIERSGAGRVVRPNDPEAFADALLELGRLTHSERRRIGVRGSEYLDANHRPEVLADRLRRVLDTVTK